MRVQILLMRPTVNMMCIPFKVEEDLAATTSRSLFFSMFSSQQVQYLKVCMLSDYFDDAQSIGVGHFSLGTS